MADQFKDPAHTPADNPADRDANNAADGDKKPDGEAAAEEEAPQVPIGELFRYADGVDKFLMVFGGICAFLNGGGMPGFSEVFGRLIDELASNPPDVEKRVTAVALIMVYVGLVVFVLSAIQVMTWMIAAERQSTKMRQEYFCALLRQEAAFHDAEKPGALSSRLTGDIQVVKVGINDKVANGIMNFGMFVFGFGFGFYRSWQLTLVMLSTLPLIAGSGAVMAVVLTQMTELSRTGFATAADISDEVLHNIRTVQIFGQEEREVERFSASLAEAGDAGIKREFATVGGMAVTYGIIFSSYSLAFWFSGWLIRNNENTVGEITAVFFAVLMGSFGIGLVFPSIAALSEAQGAAYRIFEVLKRDPAIVSGPTKLEGFRGDIAFENVKFSYPTRRETKLFESLNLEVKAGETVAFSGASGCGKSSVISLVQRLYDPDAGRVTVDGTDLKQLDLEWWRANVGVVSQEPTLFSGTLADNVRVGKPDATDAEVEEACRKANIHHTIISLPEGYDTTAGSVGSQLSGGQKQRLAIARAIIKAPKLLILDEATSALDRKSEIEVQTALDDIMKGEGAERRTVFVIAHRLVTIRNVDKIYFVEHDDVEGSFIAEAGSYDELMMNKGPFANMVAKQQASQAAIEDDEMSPVKTVTNASMTKVGTPGTTTSVKNKSFGEENVLAEQAEAEVENKEVPLTRLIKLSAEKTWAVILGLLGSLISGGIYPAYAVVLAKMLEVLGTKTNQEIEDETPFWAGMFVVLGVSAFVGWILQGFYGFSGEHLTMKLRRMLFESMLRQDMTFFDMPGRDPGSLGGMLSGDAEAIHLLWGPSLGYKVQMACNLLVGVAIALYYQWKIALVTMSMIPVMIITGAVQQMLIIGFGGSAEAGDSPENTIVSESLGNVRTVLAFNMIGKQVDEFSATTEAAKESGTRIGIIAGIIFGFSQFTFYGTFALAFWYGGTLMQKGEANFSDVMIASMAILMGAMGAGEAGGFAAKAENAGMAAKKVFALIDRVPGITAGAGGESDFGNGCSIDFNDVKFVYPSRPKAVVLKTFNNCFPNGHSIGLIGSTGCGKSTIINMLARFYDPAAGSIEVNGNDLRNIDLRAWRKHISIVSQEPSLFSGTVRDNIAYGIDGATSDDVERVAKAAFVHDDIMDMEKGYETDVGYKGRQLSGGQKQRVAIARAMLRTPRLLLLDEATSALDPATEAKVVQSILSYSKDMTVVSVAHRLTTIQNSDKIVLLDAGVVLEQGSHSELMAKDGHYKKRYDQYQQGMR